jgi:hypothetical protein
MPHLVKSRRSVGSVLRPVLASLLVISGLALLARAGSPVNPTTPVSPNAVAATPGVPRFQNYPAPAGIADDVGEPSIGCNWKSETTHSNSMFSIANGGRVMLFGGFSPALYRATFDDCSSPAKALWEAKPLMLATAPRAAGDPILFTDHDTGRTFVSQLVGITPAGSTTDITDDDGDTLQPSEGSSLPSDLDHQTFGGGRYHDPAPVTAGAYPNAVYYASQSVADARAARSDDGGVTFGPAFPMYTINQCAGLHGHVKVSPKDGTVYIPNVGCGGAVPFHDTGAKQAVIVSEDNGMTWNIRPIPDSTTHGNGSADNQIIGTRDPSVSIDEDGTVYFVYQAEDRLTPVVDGPNDHAGDTHPKVAVSHDHGLTWEPSIDVGANVINGGPIKNATFVAATAGSSGRASVAFFGTETGGNNWPCGEGDDCSVNAQGVATGINPRPPFAGVWYLYISTTFDGGKTWTTQNVTVGDPVQRGGICGGSTCRNLLDFMDLQIDKRGRILVAGEDGCVDACVAGGANSFTAKGFITRQSGGKTMLAQYDPVEPALAGAPLVSAAMDNAKLTVKLSWPTPDNGGSDITGYNVYRSIGGAAFTLLTTTTNTEYTDITFDKNQTNAYRVTAINGLGEGPYCHDVVPILLPPVENICTTGLTLLSDPAGDTHEPLGFVNTPAPPGADLRQLRILQPFAPNGIVKLIFQIQTDVGQDPQPPASGWFVSMKMPDGKVRGVRMVWRGPTPTFESYIANPSTGGTTDGRFSDAASIKPAEPESKYEAAKGLITIVVKASDLALNPGDVIAGFNSAVTQSTDVANIGRGVTGTYDEMPDSLVHTGALTFGGNAPCAPNLAPTAKLVANPEQGNPPLTVNFDGSGSVDPDAGDSIASYTFSFGDGSPDVTQSSPTISHTYKHGGGFFATLTVKDTKGTQSANVASVPIKVSAQLLNLSTRLRVQPGDKALIGGLIIVGQEPKKVILRGIGPSLNVPGKLDDPTLELHNSAGATIASNDDWKSDQANVQATGIPPSDDRESAIVTTLNPGSYTVILRGKNNSSGIGVVETYDIALEAGSRLANLSSRGFIGTNDDVLIGGFYAGPQTAAITRMVFRAIGPSLSEFNVPQPMQDPTIELHNGNGDIIASNDDWQSNQKAAIEATGLQPKDSRESAIVMTNFEPGPYTVIVRGKANSTGVGLVEIYDVQQ